MSENRTERKRRAGQQSRLRFRETIFSTLLTIPAFIVIIYIKGNEIGRIGKMSVTSHGKKILSRRFYETHAAAQV